MRQSAGVVIIGGGVIGCAIAYYLARKGCRDVVLLERYYLASGATGRCGAGVRQQWGTEINITLARESVRRFERMNEELGYRGDVEFKQKGYLLLAYTSRQVEQFQQNIRLQQRLGVPVRLVGPQEAREIIPILNIHGLLAAAYCPTDGHANPFHVTQAYAEAARRLGAEIHTYTEVTGIRVERGRVTGITTDRGSISTPQVINATGAHGGVIGRMVGLDLPLYPERHQVLVTEPWERLQDPMVISFHHRLYCQQTPHGSFIMGVGDPNEPKTHDQNATWQFLREMAGKITWLLPPLKDIRVVRQWAGSYDMSPDANPILGECGIQGFYTAAGFSGHGFMVAPAVAEMVADAVLTGTAPQPIRHLGWERFSRGDLLVEPSVV